MINEELKKQIDGMSYYELLKRWRFADLGDPMFQDEVGDYYAEVMNKRRDEVGPDKHVATSKAIGW